MKKTKIKNISVIGLGKLGAAMVAAFASRGFRVIGLDQKSVPVQKLQNGIAPVLETDLQKFIRANKKRISATEDYTRAILNSEITFVVVPTPSEIRGGFSTKYVKAAAQRIGEALRKKTAFHLISLTSTVLPGSTENDLIPVLEKHSGKKCGRKFAVTYNPEFIALGSVIKNLLHPDFTLIGESDKKTGDILESFYDDLYGHKTSIKRMNIVNAEIAKIALNTYVTTKISYANMLAELCEKIPGANVDTVTDAIGTDTRIGTKYLKGAMGYAGPCFPRDNRAFSYAARKFGTRLLLAEATDTINKRQVKRIVTLIERHLEKNGKVGILGLAYKPDTNVVDESQGVAIASLLSRRRVPVTVYDPLAMNNARRVLGNKVHYATSLKKCIAASNLVVITTPWEEFRKLSPALFKQGGHKRVLIDCWKIFNKNSFKTAGQYIAPGVFREERTP